MINCTLNVISCEFEFNCEFEFEFDKFVIRIKERGNPHTHAHTQHTWRMRYVRVFWPAAINGFQLLELPCAAKVSVIMMSFSEYYASLI